MLAAFIDLQKAFDKVWKDDLLVKLQRSGIQDNIYRWTKSYLPNRREWVLVDGICGRNGVPQGGVVPPTLFILYMKDLVSMLPKGIHAALYADDLVLWCTKNMQPPPSIACSKPETRSQNGKQLVRHINKQKSSATLFSLSTKTQAGQLHI
jgi:hypothetical protein